MYKKYCTEVLYFPKLYFAHGHDLKALYSPWPIKKQTLIPFYVFTNVSNQPRSDTPMWAAAGVF